MGSLDDIQTDYHQSFDDNLFFYDDLMLSYDVTTRLQKDDRNKLSLSKLDADNFGVSKSYLTC